MIIRLAQDSDDVTSVFSWTAALQYSVLVVTLLTGLLVLARGLGKRIDTAAKKAVKAANDAKAEWKTSNGHTAGQVLDQLPVSIEELKEIACSNRDLAQQSLKLGLQNREDLLAHRNAPVEHAHGVDK